MSIVSRVNDRVVIVAGNYAQYREECFQLGFNPRTQAFHVNREVDLLGRDNIKIRFHHLARFEVDEYAEIRRYLQSITHEEV